jgi:hypothetical protein
VAVSVPSAIRVQREQVLICRAQAASHVYNAKILTCIFATKQNPSTRLVKNESFKKSDSIICEFQFFCLSLHAELAKSDMVVTFNEDYLKKRLPTI